MIKRRAGISLIALIMLLVFLLTLTIQKLDKAERDRDQIKAALNMSQNSIVEKLVEVFTPIIQGEQEALQRGQTPTERIETVIEKLQGIDPKLIEEAVKRAYIEVNKATPSTPTTSAKVVSSTTTTASSTTTTTSAPTTTTTRSSPSTTTTTTARPCALGLNIPGLTRLCI